MSIRLILHGKVKDGMTEVFKEAGAAMTAASKEEPGTTTYQWFLSDDGHFMNYDVYDDEAAFFAHFGAATESGNADKYMGAADFEGVMVLDPVNDEMKAGLADFGAVHYAMFEGF